MRRRLGPLVAVIFHLSLYASYSSPARAGGFETPDNGTEALGRGGAFTAKASDATALEYNVAGLANQRGTRVLFDGKITFDSYTFARSGIYPAGSSPIYGNHFFPAVSNQGVPFFAPFVGLSTDFGYFDKLTVAVGAFGPSGVGNPVFPLGIDGGVPSPARYDIVASTSTIILPTIAAAYRVADWIDIGAAVHYVSANFNLLSTSFVDLGPTTCPTVEYQPCDSVNQLTASGSTVTGSGGLMLHPDSWLDLGLNVRGPINLTAQGTVVSSAPAVAPSEGTSTGAATLQTSLPWNIRAGARAKFMSGDFENGDIEIDGVYEPWGSTANGGNVYVSIPKIALFSDVNTVVRNNFQDVFSLRFGTAYNVRTGGSGVFTIRGGAYYESPGTLPADTRIDFNTLAKYAGTIGLGFSYRGVGLNLAFAEIYSSDRVVVNGDIAPINPAQHGQSIDSAGNPLPAVNNGTYSAGIQMLSFGVRVEIETLLGTNRSKRWSAQGTSAFDGTASAPSQEAKAEAKADVPAPAKAKPEPKAVESKAAKTEKAEPAPPPPPEAPVPARKKAPKPKPENDDDKTRRLEDPFAT